MPEILVPIIVALLGCGGTIIGSYFGVRASNKLVAYRIEQLEKKVDVHNGVIDRTYKLEEKCALIEKDMTVANHRISDLEERE